MRIPILTAVTIGSLLLAQEPTTIKVDVDVVNVLASVRDKKGALIPNLEKQDFTVLEDGKPQSIKYFTRESDLPLTIGMLVDVSGSQANLIGVERSAASQFFREVLRKKDLAFLISFAEETELLQDYTSSGKLLTDGLSQLRPASAVSGATTSRACWPRSRRGGRSAAATSQRGRGPPTTGAGTGRTASGRWSGCSGPDWCRSRPGAGSSGSTT